MSANADRSDRSESFEKPVRSGVGDWVSFEPKTEEKKIAVVYDARPLTIRNDSDCATATACASQLGRETPRLVPRLVPDRLERRVAHSERDQVRVVLLDQARQV